MNHQDKIVVLLKTHIWTSDLENFAIKILNDIKLTNETNGTDTSNIDFYILMHDETDETFNKISSDKIKNIVLKLKEQDIKNIYPNGFISMWLSNHWIMMWFFKKFGNKYKYIWSMEYDVRISGSAIKLWNCTSLDDFLYPMGNYRNINHCHNHNYVGGKLNESEKYHGYLQLARYSNTFLKYLDKCFDEGENGQDELIIFSLINRSGLTSSKKILQKCICGVWTWQNKYSYYNKKMYEQYEKTNVLHIYHPIK